MAHPPNALDPAALLEQAQWVRTLVRRLIRDEALAEEVVQDTWVAALERRPAADRSGGLRAWLAAVARNLSLRARRRELVRSVVEHASARSERIGGGQDEVERMQLQQKLAGAVLELEEPYRSAVILRHLDGLSSGEIAGRQGCTVEAARQRVARGLAMLRARLEREFGERGTWCAALVKLAGQGWNGFAAGGLVMGTKLAVGAAGVLALAAALWTIEAKRGERSAALAGEERPPEPALGPATVPGREPRTDASSRETLAPAPAAAQRQTIAAEPRAPSALRVRGTVTDTRNNPLPEALLAFPSRSGEATEVNVGADGSFELDLPRRAGPLPLTASCPGYVSETLLVEPGPLSIALKALPSLAGRLVDIDGLPVEPPGQVRLEIEEADTGQRASRDVEIGAGGSFALAGLPVGNLARVWARARGFASCELAPELALEPDRTLALDVELPRGAVVTGVVLDANTREPVPLARVWLETFDWEGETSIHPGTIADENGRFRLEGAEEELRPNSSGLALILFKLLGEAEGYGPSHSRAYATTPNDAHEYEFELSLEPANCTLRARVLLPDGGPAGEADVWAIGAHGAPVFDSTDEEGALVLEGLPAGPLALWIRTSGAALRVDVELSPGEERHEEFLLEAPGGCLSGRVVDLQGRPVAGLTVKGSYHFTANSLAIGLDAVESETDAEGRFEFEELHAGRYGLELCLEETSTPCSAPGHASVEVAPDGEARVDFAVGPCFTIQGRVDTGGEPCGVFEVWAQDPRSDDRCGSARIEADGTFHFEPLLARDYGLVLVRGREELDRTSVGPATGTGVVLRAPPR